MGKKKIGIIVVIVGMVAIIAAIFGLSGMHHQDDSAYIDFVKQSSPTSYSGITYQRAFNTYFSNVKWSYFVSEKNKNIVEFSGKSKFLEKGSDIKIQFLVDLNKKYFDIYGMEIDNLVLDVSVSNEREIIIEFIELIFERYEIYGENEG